MAGRALPWWAWCSATAAPVLLIGGWTLAAAAQPVPYDPVVQTISALAGLDAGHRWIMTSGLAGLGGCHLVTALGLRIAGRAGRATLAAGGVATALVAAFPLPRDGAGSTAHTVTAAVAFSALALWPALAGRGPAGVPAFRRALGVAASVVLLGLVGWFAVELAVGDRVGLAERVAAAAQALCPLAVVVSAGRGTTSGPGAPGAGSARAGSRSDP